MFIFTDDDIYSLDNYFIAWQTERLTEGTKLQKDGIKLLFSYHELPTGSYNAITCD